MWKQHIRIKFVDSCVSCLKTYRSVQMLKSNCAVCKLQFIHSYFYFGPIQRIQMRLLAVQVALDVMKKVNS